MIGNKNFIKAPNLPQHDIVRQAKAVTQRQMLCTGKPLHCTGSPTLDLLYKLTLSDYKDLIKVLQKITEVW
ncbi:hypothetical protein [Fischerella thermalis]|nr:hypothetical protein [Fischerella thermalis]